MIFFLTDSKISKDKITPWFLESLYREVLVFWCFKIFRCLNSAFRNFSKKEYLHTRPEYSYAPLDAFTPHKHTYTSPVCSQTPSSGISGHFRTTTDTNRHQTTPTDVARHPKRVFKDVWLFMLTSNVVCWRLLVSNDVLYCLMLSTYLKRMFKKFLKGYLSAEWI